MAAKDDNEGASTNLFDALTRLERQVGEIADDLKAKSAEIESIIVKVLENGDDDVANRQQEKSAALAVRDAVTVALLALEATTSVVQAVRGVDETASDEVKQRIAATISEVQELIHDARGAAVRAKTVIELLRGAREPGAEEPPVEEIDVTTEEKVGWRRWVVDAAKGVVKTVMALKTAADDMTWGASEEVAVPDDTVPLATVDEDTVRDVPALEQQPQTEKDDVTLDVADDVVSDVTEQVPEEASEATPVGEDAAQDISEPAAEGDSSATDEVDTGDDSTQDPGLSTEDGGGVSEEQETGSASAETEEGNQAENETVDEDAAGDASKIEEDDDEAYFDAAE